MDSRTLESAYVSALSRIDPLLTTTEKQTPIFRRDTADAKKQAIRDAAEALTALWAAKGPKIRNVKPIPALPH